ncbi:MULTISPECIES: aspartate aminotransferase family protein [Caldilinea]|uniref:(S)-3-amino-2-methylpropionate transaminase n=1 Tax=Caldilinea aerophila (strain DSM 14535 / JCM 11387 / NBRC 104270 / STL-6-O1) TaxID=926550 RepID=I0HZZ4_CALAS|nr:MULTISPECIES: aminotransferase class III-fold pyridoxal phosphate-dependent enzyme [Caldilinea]BAL98581.1 4-aminobutyrate aminotransferase [Caldilinea aerophila DSM 14535 = NBRC 104270]GIV74837.1 MAG: aspartate aminotransferase family protein [Caldilinea sp.]
MRNALDLLSPVWTHLTHVQPVRGEGVYLYDADGVRYMDFTSGIGVTNTGHAHPRVVQAIQEQASALIFGQMNIVITPAVLRLAQKLDEVTPPSIEQFFFSNSGAEAVEASVKLARMATKRRNLIVMQGSFHGRTHQAMAMTTSKSIYRYDYQPLPGGVFVTPFPYSYYYGWSEEETTHFCLRQLDQLLHSQSAPDETAAIVIEPVLGEGGYVPAPDVFLRELRALCDRHGILLIIDEVQSGFGRTGKFFAFEHADVEPDILVMAKGLGSGMPISAIGARAELMARWKPGTHGGTYGGGNAVAAAAAAATIDVIREEGLVENAARQGARLLTGLREIQAEHPVIGDVRGRGLMVGVEFTGPDGRPAADIAARVQAECLQRNLLLLTCGSYSNVIRWIPPLVVTAEQIDEALTIFNEAMAAAER